MNVVCARGELYRKGGNSPFLLAHAYDNYDNCRLAAVSDAPPSSAAPSKISAGLNRCGTWPSVSEHHRSPRALLARCSRRPAWRSLGRWPSIARVPYLAAVGSAERDVRKSLDGARKSLTLLLGYVEPRIGNTLVMQSWFDSGGSVGRGEAGKRRFPPSIPSPPRAVRKSIARATLVYSAGPVAIPTACSGFRAALASRAVPNCGYGPRGSCGE